MHHIIKFQFFFRDFYDWKRPNNWIEKYIYSKTSRFGMYQHNATNLSRIIATLWPIHKSLQNCVTSIHGFRYIATYLNFFSYLLTMSWCNDVSMSRFRDQCIDVAMWRKMSRKMYRLMYRFMSRFFVTM